jgi:cation diffusion facilitator family transporter
VLPELNALRIALFGNFLLMTGKLVVGWTSGSQALLADGFHSFTDVLSALVGTLGSHIASQPADEDHPYGHGNAENIAAVLVSIIMFFAGWELLQTGVSQVLKGTRPAPSVGAAYVAILSLVIKELMHRQAAREAATTHSPTVEALARDHRSDALSCLAALVGIILARTSNPLLDPLASLVISGLVLQIAWVTLSDNLHVLMDGEPEEGEELRKALQKRADEDPDVIRVGSIRVHQVGADLHLQIDLEVPPEWTVAHAHEAAHRVENWAKEIEARVRSAQVHVEPTKPSMN